MDKTTVKEIIEYKHGKHNQIVHGNRYGKAPSLERARRLRSAGEWGKYRQEARRRSPKKTGSQKPSPTKRKPKKRARGYRGLNTIPKRTLNKLGKGLQDKIREELADIYKKTGKRGWDANSPKLMRLQRGLVKIQRELRDRERGGDTLPSWLE